MVEPVESTGTYVREGKFEIIPCSEADECRDGWFTFDRESLDRMLTIAQSEEECRKDEMEKLDEPAGWDPLVVVLVTGGVVVVVGGAAFLAGYLVAQ